MQVIFITIFAALFTQLGYFYWKIAANNSNESKFNFKNYLLNWQWILGMIFTILGWFLFVKATDVGEISLVEPLMSIGEIFLILLAFFFFKERLNIKEWVGIFLSFVGVFLLSSEAKVSYTNSVNWIHLYDYISISILIGTILYFWAKEESNAEVYLGIVCGISFGIAAVLTELMTAHLEKNGQSLVSLYFFINPIFPFMMLANIISLILIQVALKSGRVSVVIPVELSIVSAMSVIGGMFIFSEKISILRFFGILIILFGTFLLHKKE